MIANQAINYTNPLIIITDRQNLPGLPANRHTIANRGGGNCLYHSVQQGLEAIGTDSTSAKLMNIGINRGSHSQLRRDSIDLILLKGQDYRQDCRRFNDQRVDQFHQQYIDPGEFGNDICIIALVDLLQINIKVHTQARSAIATRSRTRFSHSVATFSPTGGSLHTIEIICHVHRYHFECVLPGAAPAVGLQAVLPTPSATEVDTCESSI